MIKNIVLDMGNVLLKFDPEVSLCRYCETEEIRDIIRRELFEGPEWIMGDYGTITNAERFEPVSRRVPVSFHRQLKDCVDHWNICMQPIPGAKTFCEYLKSKDYRIYVLSNADDTFFDYFPRFAEVSYFDGIMVSSSVHFIKPDIKIYQLFLDTYHLLPEECLFIDDREENAEGARKAGMQAVVYAGDFEPIKKNFHL